MSAVALEEYALGVQGGRVVSAAELDEAGAILNEARRRAGELSAKTRDMTVAGLDSMMADAGKRRPVEALRARLDVLRRDLEKTLGATLDLLPASAPSLVRGAKVYQLHCQECHGTTGAGDGPKAAKLDPKPANFALRADLHAASPLAFVRKINVGVSGTEMKDWESILPLEDRWAAALYVTSLRHTDAERARGGAILKERCPDCAITIGDLGETAGVSDDSLTALLAARLGSLPADSDRVAALAYARTAAAAEVWGGDPAVELTRTLSKATAGVAEAVTLAGSGDRARAQSVALDAYLVFERLETPLRARNAQAAATVEQAFRDLRSTLAVGTPADIDGARAAVLKSLETGRAVLSAQTSSGMLFSQSFIIMLREGLEAILIVGALMAVAVKAGAPERKRDMVWGVLVALVASLATAAVLAGLVRESTAHREALEGAVMVIAAAVLFSVSYWLISKIEVKKWQAFVGGKVKAAITSGGGFALAGVAFLAVYREGFETVLFYAALFASGKGPGSSAAITGGIVAGFGVLSVVFYAIQRWGVRLPLKPFFAVTSIFLYLMAFSFAGQGVADLQEAGVVPATQLRWVPSVPALGIFPTTETVAIQSLLAVAVVGALVWVFWLEPRTAKRA